MTTPDLIEPASHATLQVPLEEQFSSIEQQSLANTFGMWVFLASELLFFGPLLFGYFYLRVHFPHESALASRHTLMLAGTINTAVLLTGSLAVAVAGQAVRLERRRLAARLLLAAAVLGVVFIAIKSFEYYKEFGEHLFPGAGFHPIDARTVSELHGMELFFLLYFALTGLHALHLTIGIVACAAVAFKLRHPPPRGAGEDAVELTGLYWHFVDVVWVILYPLLYLVGRSGGL
jgi:cytochrome c oxidase subunit 3